MAEWRKLLADGDVGPVKNGVIFYAPFNRSVNASYSEGTGTGTLTTGKIKGIWHLEEGTGTNLDDEGGNSYDLTTVNTPTWTADGKHGSALDFEDSSSEYAYRTASTIALNEVTWGAWVKAESVNATAMDIVSNGFPFALRMTNTYFGSQANTDEGGLQTATWTTTPSTGTWYFVVATLSQSNQRLRIYVDGDLKDTNTDAFHLQL